MIKTDKVGNLVIIWCFFFVFFFFFFSFYSIKYSWLFSLESHLQGSSNEYPQHVLWRTTDTYALIC